ncbi:MAG: DUF2341 domain-containing protein [Chitinispirillaceae bacterium]|nr:DUF2341 domain-containing protein [Chitinispirillaceae bacterium]
MIRSALFSLVTAAGTIFLTCADLGGIGHEGEARISGQLVLPDGTPAAQTQVTLFPKDYDPVKGARTIPLETTDAQGNYLFPRVSPGDYTILAINSDRRIRTLISGIRVAGNEISVPACTLFTSGAIKVTLSGSSNSLTAYAYIPGTNISSFFDTSSWTAILDSVPAGTIPAVYYAASISDIPVIVRDDIPVASADTAIIANPSWKHAKRIFLNTTSSGAGVSGNVKNFPVLVRLNSGNFNFSQANPHGADIRFTKRDNMFLSHEIERWDPVARLAEIWVKVDTVHGNDSTQSVVMYWGNPAATDSSRSATVFDTTNGFQGVWHFAQAGNVAMLDATQNHYDGTLSDTAPVSVGGAIGLCRHFNGTSTYIQMKNTASSKLNFPENGMYTVSAWVYIDTLDGRTQVIAGKGHNDYFLKVFSNRSTIVNQWEFTEYHDKAGWQIIYHPAIQKAWKHVVGVRNGTSQYLYVDGVLVNDSIYNGPDTLSRNSSFDFAIGKYLAAVSLWGQNYAHLKGSVDEVRASNTVRNPDWIKLCYMNQRKDDKLIIVK